MNTIINELDRYINMSQQHFFFFFSPSLILEGGGTVSFMLLSFYGFLKFDLVGLIPLPFTKPLFIVSSKLYHQYQVNSERFRRYFYFLWLSTA